MDMNDQNEKKKKNFKIVWYTSPWLTNVNINIGKIFVRLLNKHFLSRHKFYKLFSGTSDSSSTKSIASLIVSHTPSTPKPIDQIYSKKWLLLNVYTWNFSWGNHHQQYIAKTDYSIREDEYKERHCSKNMRHEKTERNWVFLSTSGF